MTSDARERIRREISGEHALIATLAGEAYGEPIEGHVAVASVIRNRALARPSKWWGGTYREVCLKPAQFSCWWEENANTDQVYDIAQALMKGTAVIGERSLLAQLQWVAAGVLGEQLRDNTGGCDHYLTRTLYESARCPAWAKNKPFIAQRGAHVFLRLEL